MKETWKRSALMAALLVASIASGCAQDIGDIDRTEPNKIKKSDLTEGTWFMNQKITHADAVAGGVFEGITFDSDKVRFVAEENYLIAYRTYADLPGSENTALNMTGEDSYEELYDANYKGTIRAMYPISSHFDVQRSYDTATGEQSNVIVENTSDRRWWEREYMRVDWSSNPIVDWEKRMGWGLPEFTLGYSHADEISEDGSDPAAPYFERNKDGVLVYFDTPTTVIVQPSIWECVGGQMLGWFFGTCNATEARLVTSFIRDMGDRNYEPVRYTNQDMNRFGFFRTERYTYDQYYGIMNDGRIELANRHNIWADSYNEDGSVKPISERTVKTEPYYIRNLEDEPWLDASATRVVADWNNLFKKAVRVIQGKATRPDELTDEAVAGDKDVFTICHIPVREGDNEEVCGKIGYSPREADARKNVVWIINQRTEAGLLGYCPSHFDPITGETLSSSAHVYVSAMDRTASAYLQFIQYVNGDLDEQGIVDNEWNRKHAKETAGQLLDLQYKNAIMMTKNVDVTNDRKQSKMAKEARRDYVRKNPQKFNYVEVDNRAKKAYDDGLFQGLGEDAIQRFAAKRANVRSFEELSDEQKQYANSFSQLSYAKRKYREALTKSLGANGFCSDERTFYSFDPKLAALAREFYGRHDYDNILREIRGRVFVSTTLHEMGHGFGLRHNFAASYDTLNYQDRYWQLRPDENWMKDIDNPNDMLAMYNYNDKQLGQLYKEDQLDKLDAGELANSREFAKKGGLMLNSYSSIMDYTGYNTDFSGLGKYDLAAIIYGYSKGVDIVKNEPEQLCLANGGEVVNGTDCKREVSGIIEVFDKKLGELGTFGKIVTHEDTTGAVSAKVNVMPEGASKVTQQTLKSTFNDATTFGVPYTELIHYHDVMRSFPDSKLGQKDSEDGNLYAVPDFMTKRNYVRLEDYHKSRILDGDNALVRVPYYFCTDDNANIIASCKLFDYGADMYEQMKEYIDTYDKYYWFSNYARGRAYYDPFEAAWGQYGNFIEMSDLFQNWYAVAGSNVLDSIIDENEFSLASNVDEAAAAAGVNTLLKAIVTPEYGLYCLRKDDNSLYPLSSKDDAQAETSKIYRLGICGENPTYYYVKPGEGRRRFSKYDLNAGFDYSMYPYEMEHNYVSLMAAMAVMDNEASVIIDGGDMNTYVFGMYDYFGDAVTNTFNGMFAEDYKSVSPVLDISKNEVITQNGEEVKTGTLVFKPMAYADFWGKSGHYEYDPLTGLDADAMDEIQYASGNPVVETQISLTQRCYMGLYSIMYSADGLDTTYYDQLNVWVNGTGSEVTPANGFDTVSFESPFTGEIYSANYVDCTKADLSNPPAICVTEGFDYKKETGGYAMIKKANRSKAKMVDAYTRYMTLGNALPGNADENSPAYQEMLAAYYEYIFYKWETEGSLRDINMMRTYHEYFGYLF